MATVVKTRIVRPRGQSAEAAPPPAEQSPPTSPPPSLPPEDLTFNRDSLLTDVYSHYCDTNPRVASEATTKRYFATLICFEKHLQRPPKVSDLTTERYNSWLKWRRDACGVAPSTLHGEAQKFLVIWRWLARRREVAEPNVMLPRAHWQEKKTWVIEEWRRIEAAGRCCDWYVGHVQGRIFWPAFLGVMVETGERLGAVHKLEAHHFDFEKRQVCFPREIRKGKTRDLTKRLSPQTVLDVKALLVVRQTRPFAPLLQPSMYHGMRRLLMDAGLPSDRSRLYHCIRRFHATQVALAGGNAQRSLDHSDARVTERYVDESQLPPPPIPSRGEQPDKPTTWLGKLFGK